MKQFLDFIIARLKEKTTWGVIVSAIGGIVGGTFIPAHSEDIQTFGLALAAFIGGISSEQPKV